jgi:hypothetical protein
MPHRKQPPQQDPEEEDDNLVTDKQFKEMMHMMESLTASMNETFNKATTPMNEMLHKSQASTKTTLEQMQRGIVAMADWFQALETWLPIVATDTNAAAADTHVYGDPFTEDPGVDNDEHSELPDPPPRQRRPFNRQGIRGNQNYHNQHYVRNDDPFAKVKFSIPRFNGSYDAEAYLDWEMIAEQKFSFHLVPEQHHVRQATSEFKDFTLIWWNELATLGLQAHTWDVLKTTMHQRFVPPSYQRDLCKKLQRLDQGDMSVQDYYAELPKGMICAGVHEETEDKICCFMGGCELKFRILLTIKNIILLIVCSSLLCWQRRNYRTDNR